MFSILIIDDADDKVKALREFFTSFEYIVEDDIDIADSYHTAIGHLSAKVYDIVILDLYLPLRKGETSSPENGISLLRCIKDDGDLKRPLYIVGFTREIPTDAHREEFNKNMWFLIETQENSNRWREALRNLMEHMRNAKLCLQNTTCYDYDVAIINALQTPENDILKQVLSNDKGWEQIIVKNDNCTSYYGSSIETSKHRNIKIVTCHSNQMGGEAIAALTTKVIYHFRPKYVFMTGIMAALESPNIALGDVIVAQEVFNGASGKIKDVTKKQEGTIQLMPDYKHFNTDPSFINIVNELKKNNLLLKNIVEESPCERKSTSSSLKIHTGPVASMPAVITSDQVVKFLEGHARKLVGIEMEAYGMYYAAENAVEPRPKIVAVIKSVSDYANSRKNDSFQDYASYTSAAFLKYILCNKLSYES